MHIEEAGLAQAVETAGPHLGYVHIGESHRGDLGTGNVDFPQLFRFVFSPPPPTSALAPKFSHSPALRTLGESLPHRHTSRASPIDACDFRTHVLLYLTLGRWPTWATRAPSPSSRSRRAWSPPRSPTRFVSGVIRGRIRRWEQPSPVCCDRQFERDVTIVRSRAGDADSRGFVCCRTARSMPSVSSTPRGSPRTCELGRVSSFGGRIRSLKSIIDMVRAALMFLDVRVLSQVATHSY